MIKVLVVDDDRLVRKGLISAMPWADFDMRVVGEAGNGADALAFLENQAVDLMMIDLAMPVMSGIELMRVVSRRFPKIYMVVLTFHQDFEYVQEALRLGALDYIAKLQLEREQFEEVLERITQLILRDRNLHGQPTSVAQTAVFHQDDVLAVLTAEEQPETAWLRNERLPCVETIELDDGLWVFTPPETGEHNGLQERLLALLPVSDGWRVLHLAGVQGENHAVVYRHLRKYRQGDFFYEDRVTAPLLVKTFPGPGNDKQAMEEVEWDALKVRWLSFHWVTKQAFFDDLLAELQLLRLPPVKLIPFMMAVQVELRQLCATIHPFETTPHEKISRWADLEAWLQLLRDQASRILSRQVYSEEVIGSVLQAVKIVFDELDLPLTVQDIANRVNMSRSYFSQVFRDVTGRPFHEFLRQARMDRAKDYLLHTDHPIHWVALHTGFADEKYFSHMFREQTSLLPSEFRKQGGNSSTIP